MGYFDIAELARKRFQNELGYRFSAANPIYEREKGNRVMYYMFTLRTTVKLPCLWSAPTARP